MLNEEQNLLKASQKSPFLIMMFKIVSEYDQEIPQSQTVCLWLKHYSVLFLFFHLIFLKIPQRLLFAFYTLTQISNIWLLE